MDDPQNLEHLSFKELKSLGGQTHVAWIDEGLKISVADTVVNLRKSANMRHRNSSKNRVNSLGLIKSSNHKTCLTERILLTRLSIVSRVQDDHQETQYLFNVFPNWASQHRSNSNMIQRKNSELKLKDPKHMYSMVLTDLRKGN
jgi:hypothetical protein